MIDCLSFRIATSPPPPSPLSPPPPHNNYPFRSRDLARIRATIFSTSPLLRLPAGRLPRFRLNLLPTEGGLS